MSVEKQIARANEEEKKVQSDFRTWVKIHKRELIIIGVSIPSIIVAIASIKNKDILKKVWNKLKEEIEAVDLYSSDWFAKATDAELNLEREKVRLAYCSSGEDFDAAVRLQNLLWRFDKEMSKRAWGDEIPRAPSIHREHGWYLSNDD